MKLRHFTLRDLFWLILVVALATGWALDRFKLESARRNEAAQRQRAEAQAQYTAALVAAQLVKQQVDIDRANQSLQLDATILADDVQYFSPGPETRTKIEAVLREKLRDAKQSSESADAPAAP
jgi:hypothetical protein